MGEARIRQLFKRLEGRLPLGFGVGGALATRLFSSREIDRLIGTARDQGISIFDTAPSYGAGLGEHRLGQSIGNNPSAFVMTKAGLTAKGVLDRVSDFTPQSIVQSVDASLRRLKRDRIDLLWLHGPGRHQIDVPLIDALGGLIRSGKVAALGIASRDRAASAMADLAPFSALMAPVHDVASTSSLLSSKVAFFGIEGLRHVPTDPGIPRHRGQLWRAARTILRGHKRVFGTISAHEAFDFAFETAQCDVLVTTTTKAARIKQNRTICEGFIDRLRDHEGLAWNHASQGAG